MQRSPATGDTSLFQVFERINSSGKTLLPQEIRNCVYQGPLNSLLIELNKNPKWRLLFGRPERDERMRDLEFILRFFALSSYEIMDHDEPPSHISLKKYLNQYMDSNNSDEYINGFRTRFNQCIDFAFEEFSTGAFHNISQNDDTRMVEKFSPTVFDSVIIAIDRAISRGEVDDGDGNYIERKRQLLKDDEYQNLLYMETMRVPKIRDRVNKMYTALFGDSNEQ